MTKGHGTGIGRSGDAELRNLTIQDQHGETVIAQAVIEQIARDAASRVQGVHEVVTPPAMAAWSGLTQDIVKLDRRRAGVRIKVDKGRVSIRLVLRMEYGADVVSVSEEVRRAVRDEVQSLAGVSVDGVDVKVTSLYRPDENDDDADPTPGVSRPAGG